MTTRLESFLALVRDMRAAQRDYFKTRSPESLRHSKGLEGEVDREIRQLLRPSTYLLNFGQPADRLADRRDEVEPLSPDPRPGGAEH